MAMIHDWHKPDPDTEIQQVYKNVDVVWRLEDDGAIHLRFVDSKGQILSTSLTSKETDRLAEFLWTDRK